MEILPGTRVKVFDSKLYKNDKITPPSYTMRPATVVCRYGYRNAWIYPDCIDVIFDHRPGISRAHFTDGVEVIEQLED